MKNSLYRKITILTILCTFTMASFYCYGKIKSSLPDQYTIYYGDELNIKSRYPVSFIKKDFPCSVNVSNQVKSDSYNVEAKLFNMIPLKNIKINVIPKISVIPCGFQIGLYLHTNGVMVIGTENVKDIHGNESSPANNIVQKDDYIVSLNGIKVSSKSQLTFLINKYGNSDITLGINRHGSNFEVKIKPVSTGKNQFKAGIWVRDDSQGIGTLTSITKDGIFAGLGHGINDVDTGNLLSSENGIIYNANIWGIKTGKRGNPGGLLGTINYDKENELGTIRHNTNFGIFGIANKKLLDMTEKKYMSIALKDEIKTGKAVIRCRIDNKIQDFEIEIEKIDHTNNGREKGMIIHVTDDILLKKTGGIIQGMSGSPIIQGNKLIGALTHVFVDDPTRGYGIFIETMINEE